MSIEINISKNGKHYFATAERSLNFKSEGIKMFKDLKKRFPESEGFKLSISDEPKISYDITEEVEEEIKANG